MINAAEYASRYLRRYRQGWQRQQVNWPCQLALQSSALMLLCQQQNRRFRAYDRSTQPL